MKKICLALLLILSLFVFASCDGNISDNQGQIENDPFKNAPDINENLFSEYSNEEKENVIKKTIGLLDKVISSLETLKNKAVENPGIEISDNTGKSTILLKNDVLTFTFNGYFFEDYLLYGFRKNYSGAIFEDKLIVENRNDTKEVYSFYSLEENEKSIYKLNEETIEVHIEEN